MLATENYNLDLYEANDPANLLDGYNDAMSKIDVALKANADTTQTAQDAATKVQTAIDKIAPFDTTPTLSSTKGVTSGGIRAYVNDEIAKIDNELHEDSTTIFGKSAYTDYDTAVTEGSQNLVTSGAVAAYATKTSSPKYIFCGDSYADAEDDTRTWSYWLAQILSTANCYNAAVSGAGFAVSGRTFADQITSAHNKNIDADVIIIAGGRNDILTSLDAALTAVSSITTVVAAYYPNAAVIIIPMLYDWKRLDFAGMQKYNYICKAVLKQNRFRLVTNAYNWLKGTLSSNFTSTSDIHPNASGAKMLAAYIYSAIMGNTPARNEIYTTTWHGISVSCILNQNIVWIQIQGDYNDGEPPTDTLSMPGWAAPQAQNINVIGYSNSGSQYTIGFISYNDTTDKTTLTIFEGSTHGGGAGINTTFIG